MNYIIDFLKEYGFTIMYTIITAIAAFIGSKIKSIYQEKVNEKIKKDVVETCVKAVEQLYRDLHGAEKLEKAKASIISILDEKGIAISEIEMDMLIEAVVAEFNFMDLKILNSKTSDNDLIVDQVTFEEAEG